MIFVIPIDCSTFGTMDFKDVDVMLEDWSWLLRYDLRMLTV